MQNVSIKQECDIKVWNRPIPKHIQIPALPDYGYIAPITEKQFEAAIQDETTIDRSLVRDKWIRIITLEEIEKMPRLYEAKNMLARTRLYPKVAWHVYKRTGMYLNGKMIQTIFKFARDSLRARLRDYILKKKIYPDAMETELWNWEYYPYIRFQRKHTEAMEINNRMKAERYPNGDPVYHDIADDDDDGYEEDRLPNEFEIAHEEEIRVVEETPDISPATYSFKREPNQNYEQAVPEQGGSPSSNEGSFHREEPQSFMNGGTMRYRYAPYAPIDPLGFVYKMEQRQQQQPQPPPVFPTNTFATEEVPGVYTQMVRISREQPQKVRMLRSAVQDITRELERRDFESQLKFYKYMYELEQFRLDSQAKK